MSELPRAQFNGLLRVSVMPQSAIPFRATILVVDDDSGIRDLLTLILENEFRVITAKSGEEALAILYTEIVDLIVTDIVMGGMNGLELGRQIKRMRPTLPVLYMTGFPHGANPSEDLARTQPLFKPFRSAALLAAVNALLGQRPGTEETEVKSPGKFAAENHSAALCR